jgi:hypothetical protein
MKRFTLVFASSVGLVGLACLAAVPVACVASTNPSAPGDDAGPLPGEDSGTPGTDATAPGGDSGSDAGPVDSGADSADAAPAPLTLTVLSGGLPESGVLVVFQDATGAVVSTATTDATGTVSQLVVAGSQLTAALGTAASPRLVTVQSVEPGDAITLVDTASAGTTPDEPVLVTAPAPPWDASGTVANVNAGADCGNELGYSFELTASCSSAGQFPLLVRAENESGTELGYTYQTGNPLVPEDGGPLQVAISRAWATSSVTQTISAIVPGTPNMGFSYTEISGGVPVSGSGAGYETEDGGYSEAYVVHSGYPDFVQTGASAGTLADSVSSVVGGVTRAAPAATSQTTSFDLTTLPAITGSSVDSTDAGTLVQPVVSWMSAGSLSSANGIILSTYWSGDLPDGGGLVQGSWTIVTPSTTTTVQAPVMPSSAASFVPFAGATYARVPQVAALEAPFVPGYAGLKAQFGTLLVFRGSNSSPELPTLPVNGTLYLSVVYQQLD